jgi:hypothetical protein
LIKDQLSRHANWIFEIMFESMHALKEIIMEGFYVKSAE